MDDAAAARVAAAHPDLRLLLLIGSRARGTQHERSDWDLGYLADPGLDVGTLVADLAAAVGTDELDVVDLVSASAVLRRDAAMHGRPLHVCGEAWTDFQIEAMTFWCDAEPVFRQAFADVLAHASRR